MIGEDLLNRRAAIRPQDALQYDMKLPLRETFYPLGFGVEILTNDRNVLEAAQESFGHTSFCRAATPLKICIGVSEGRGLTVPPEPTRREYNHLYSLVADVENQSLLDLKTGTSFAWLTNAAVQNRLYFRYNFLEKMIYLQLGATVVTDIHAACVGKRGKGFLLCGDSGAGKSTLAYACARAGWTYTSDDTCYLINDEVVPRVVGHAHRARFRPAAKALFQELQNFAITARMEGKPSIEVSTSELPIPSTKSDTAIAAVLYLNRDEAKAAHLTRLPEGTATQRMSQELFSAGDIRKKHERILEIFSKVPTYELFYSASHEAIAELETLQSHL